MSLMRKCGLRYSPTTGNGGYAISSNINAYKLRHHSLALYNSVSIILQSLQLKRFCTSAGKVEVDKGVYLIIIIIYFFIKHVRIFLLILISSLGQLNTHVLCSKVFRMTFIISL